MAIVFSDLDGTILDFHTYSYEEALEGINILKTKNIPLVLVSSKTIIEMRALHRELDLLSPFVFENGGGIVYPKKNKKQVDYEVDFFGENIDILKEKLNLFRKIIPVSIKMLFEMNVDEVMERTNLSRKSAELVKERETSMPFVAESGDIRINEMNLKLKEYGIAITKGGRFYHYSSSGVSKGYAVRKIIEYYTNIRGLNIANKNNGSEKVVTIGIGDSENDIPMLSEVQRPFLVRKHDNSAIDTGFKVTLTKGIGPAGFTEAIKSIVSSN